MVVLEKQRTEEEEEEERVLRAVKETRLRATSMMFKRERERVNKRQQDKGNELNC